MHGISAALELAEAGLTVHLVDQASALLRGTSSATHNRAHRGYHYPRSIRTARECQMGLRYFEMKYPDALEFPQQNFYAIEMDSKTSADRYEGFCRRLDLPHVVSWPEPSFLSRKRLERCFRISEPCFHFDRLRELLTRKMAAADITPHLGFRVTRTARRARRHRVYAQHTEGEIVLEADFVINATYAGINAVLEVSGLTQDRVPYVYEMTEVVVLRNHGAVLPALTIMDGPFVTLLPYVGHPGLLMMYDVVHSVHMRHFEPNHRSLPRPRSNWSVMRESRKTYFPFLDSLEYVDSLWGVRPIRLNDRKDARDTKIVMHRDSPGFVSIMEGKFISAPLVAAQMVRRLEKSMLL